MARSSVITSEEYPYLPIRVQLRGQVAEGSALIDTGFSGSLVIPTSWLEPGLGEPDGYSGWEMADGSITRAPVYLCSVEIVGLSQIQGVVATALGSEYILGRRILDRFEITLDHGQRVILRI